jgi:hypothetical protein
MSENPISCSCISKIIAEPCPVSLIFAGEPRQMSSSKKDIFPHICYLSEHPCKPEKIPAFIKYGDERIAYGR